MGGLQQTTDPTQDPRGGKGQVLGGRSLVFGGPQGIGAPSIPCLGIRVSLSLPRIMGDPSAPPCFGGATSQGYNTSLGFWGSPQYYWSPSAPPWVLGGSHTHSQHYWFPSAPPPGFGVLLSTTGPHQSSLGFWGSPMPPPDHYRSLSVPLDFGVSPMSPQHYGSPSVPS